jgi:hypothetical protein
MVRFSRFGLAAVSMCHPSVVRSRQLMGHDEGNTLKSQDNREGLSALPLKAMECGFAEFEWAMIRARTRASRRPGRAVGSGGAGPRWDRSSRPPLSTWCTRGGSPRRTRHGDAGGIRPRSGACSRRSGSSRRRPGLLRRNTGRRGSCHLHRVQDDHRTPGGKEQTALCGRGGFWSGAAVGMHGVY